MNLGLWWKRQKIKLRRYGHFQKPPNFATVQLKPDTVCNSIFITVKQNVVTLSVRIGILDVIHTITDLGCNGHTRFNKVILTAIGF